MLYGLNESNNPRLYERVYINGAIGTKQTVNVNRPISWVICSIKSGAVDIFVGEPSGRIVPELHCNQVGMPVPIPFTGSPGQYSVVASDPNNATIACIVFGGP